MRVKRVALLGATGSIGRQAIEVVERNPELELCALASGSSDLTRLAAEHGVEQIQVGGDLTELLDACEPDVVLNAVVGFAGVGATLWALERGVTLALANKESLVAAGELALAAKERGGGLLLPVDSEHSAVFQCLEGRAPDSVDSLVLTASGGPFRGRTRADLTTVGVEDALAHPTWSMGPKITVDSATLANKGLELIEAHFLFGVPYDRIEVVVHPSSIVHSLVRFRDGAALAHLGYPDMTVPISYALTYPERAATEVPQLDLAGGLTLEFSAPDLATFPLLALARRAGELGGTYPCVFNAANEVAVAAFLDGKLPFLGIAEVVEDALAAADGAPGARSGRARRGRRRGAPARRARSARRMSIFVSILGLGFLILIHEAGHFFVARGVGMNPRKFYLGFPPAIVKTKRNGIEYGVGAVPLGGYVKIPGMHRPAAGDLDIHFGRAVEEQPSLRRPVELLRGASRRATTRVRGTPSPALPRRSQGAQLSAAAAKAAERGLGDVEDALAPDAYWRAKTWKRVAVIFAGPGANLLLAVVLFAALFMAGGGQADPHGRRGRRQDARRGGDGPRAGDRIVAINGKPVARRRDRSCDLHLRRPPARASRWSATAARSGSGRPGRRRPTAATASALCSPVKDWGRSTRPGRRSA